MKPEYGPTLGRLLAPRWHAASPLARGAVIALGRRAAWRASSAIVLTLLNAPLLPRRPRALQLQLPRPLPDGARPGGYVKVQSAGAPTGALRVLLRGRAADAAALQRRALGRAAAVSRPATSPRCGTRYRASCCAARARPGSTRSPPTTSSTRRCVEGRRMYGRDVLLLPERRGAARRA